MGKGRGTAKKKPRTPQTGRSHTPRTAIPKDGPVSAAPNPQAEHKNETEINEPNPQASTTPLSHADIATAALPKKVVRRTVRTVKKGKKKNKLAILLAIVFLLGALAFLGAVGLQYMGYDVPWNIPLVDEVKGTGKFTVTPTNITLHVGDETILTSSEGCTLSSSNHDVAIVNDTGHVRGIGPGTCTITARASSSSAIVRIQVTVLE